MTRARRSRTPAAVLLALLAASLCGCGGGSTEPQPTTGTVVVRPLPADLDAGWTLTNPDGGTTDGHGTTRLTGRAPGAWRIDWKAVANWVAPPAQLLDLVANDSIVFTGEYQYVPPTVGVVRIDITPDELDADWVLKSTVGGGANDRNGHGDGLVLDLPPGEITVSWERIPGWTQPAPGWVDATVVAGDTIDVSVTYTVETERPFASVTVAPGTFTMGSPGYEPGRQTDEGPQHEVTLTRGLEVAATEITMGQWYAVMGGRVQDPTAINHPVTGVRWLDAVDFCNAKSAADGLAPAYTIVAPDTVTWDPAAAGWRLPTEAEWEYLCRAGGTTALAEGDLVELACRHDPVLAYFGWSCANADGSSQPVAALLPNAWGLYDMHGNVFEWCWDWYGDYAAGSQTDPVGPAAGTSRLIRGGSFLDDNARLRSAARTSYGPASPPLNNLGFRVVRNASGLK